MFLNYHEQFPALTRVLFRHKNSHRFFHPSTIPRWVAAKHQNHKSWLILSLLRRVCCCFSCHREGGELCDVNTPILLLSRCLCMRYLLRVTEYLLLTLLFVQLSHLKQGITLLNSKYKTNRETKFNQLNFSVA